MTRSGNRPAMVEHQYIGDGVEAGFDGFQFWIYLASGHVDRSAHDGIALESMTLRNFDQFREFVEKKYEVRV